MPINISDITPIAVKQLADFQNRIAGIPYETKGILNSEMFFLSICAQLVAPRRILESGRARGQSTLLLSMLFPELPIISIEHDPDSPDIAVAEARLAGKRNVDLRFGDATRIIPSEVRNGDIVLIDGPKSWRALRLALRILASGKASLVFIHDCGIGSPERDFLNARVPTALYSDEIEFAQIAHVLDAHCQSSLPPDRRFNDGRVPRTGYGFGLACIPFDSRVSYRRLFLDACITGFCQRHFSSPRPA